ncbi:unnamed protein product [Vitrella brassicaformis CCMP3155]|uniref:DNA/RNA-binding protein Alba-like domain-containing protein n=2 Tax=Vitrella brassicaformis TaxID=1169539 RepID=A0A0G4EQQ5_VITBC|nr:unnamed protein product [Vitrella brassicaformis CCMP3155]|mmetsp:Transcript_26540/g.65913  ORF Transcript_26540/g.65913 Transcript_26540/m.65913 type:complete len:185 (+) Transcript_26540:1020-1574(+)|eukprot:CEL99797.1 unnamed protein product [Vitrella brassicaformis CCMP3155]
MTSAAYLFGSPPQPGPSRSISDEQVAKRAEAGERPPQYLAVSSAGRKQMKDYIQEALNRIDKYGAVMLTSGFTAMGKCIGIAEIVKRLSGLPVIHQITTFDGLLATGADRRTSPMIFILLSRLPLDPSTDGYQLHTNTQLSSPTRQHNSSNNNNGAADEDMNDAALMMDDGNDMPLPSVLPMPM